MIHKTNHLLLLYIHCCIHDIFLASLIHSSLLIVCTRQLLAKVVFEVEQTTLKIISFHLGITE